MITLLVWLAARRRRCTTSETGLVRPTGVLDDVPTDDAPALDSSKDDAPPDDAPVLVDSTGPIFCGSSLCSWTHDAPTE